MWGSSPTISSTFPLGTKVSGGGDAASGGIGGTGRCGRGGRWGMRGVGAGMMPGYCYEM